MGDDVVSLQRLSVQPNSCPIDDPLDLEMDYTITKPLPDAHWQIKVEHTIVTQNPNAPG